MRHVLVVVLCALFAAPAAAADSWLCLSETVTRLNGATEPFDKYRYVIRPIVDADDYGDARGALADLLDEETLYGRFFLERPGVHLCREGFDYSLSYSDAHDEVIFEKMTTASPMLTCGPNTFGGILRFSRTTLKAMELSEGYFLSKNYERMSRSDQPSIVTFSCMPYGAE